MRPQVKRDLSCLRAKPQTAKGWLSHNKQPRPHCRSHNVFSRLSPNSQQMWLHMWSIPPPFHRLQTSTQSTVVDSFITSQHSKGGETASFPMEYCTHSQIFRSLSYMRSQMSRGLPRSWFGSHTLAVLAFAYCIVPALPVCVLREKDSGGRTVFFFSHGGPNTVT